MCANHSNTRFHPIRSQGIGAVIVMIKESKTLQKDMSVVVPRMVVCL